MSRNTITGVSFELRKNVDNKKDSFIKSAKGLTTDSTYVNNEAQKGGPIDQMFGPTDHTSLCPICGLSVTGCIGHPAHREMPEPVYNPLFLKSVKEIMTFICLQTAKPLITEAEILLEYPMFMSFPNDMKKSKYKKMVQKVKVSPYTGMQVPKIVQEQLKKELTVRIYAEYNTTKISSDVNLDEHNDLILNPAKKTVRKIFTVQMVWDLFKSIDDKTCKLIGLGTNRPEDMIIKILHIPPLSIRPSMRNIGGGVSAVDQLTTQYQGIIKVAIEVENINLKYDINGDVKKNKVDAVDLLQLYVSSCIDNNNALQKNKNINMRYATEPYKAGKQGRFRSNISGKRVNFSARSVITCDTIKIHEVGVPKIIAKTLTYPDIVTPLNYHMMTQIINNGPNKYPGANYYEEVINGKVVKKDLLYAPKVQLKVGMVVHRHLIDGDWILFNRQPTLHKTSMMAHTVKVHEGSDFKLNCFAVSPYNADFDGDEMNSFIPQSIRTSIEIEHLAKVSRHIIDSGKSKPTIAPNQDSLMGSYKLTLEDISIKGNVLMNLLSNTTLVKYFHLIEILPNKMYTGKEVMSFITPNRVNLSWTNLGMPFKITKGSILSGKLTKKEIGTTPNNIIHIIFDSYDPDTCMDYMNNLMRLINYWIMCYEGFTVGMKDIVIDKDKRDLIQNNIDRKRQKIIDLHNKIAMAEQNIDYDELNKICFSIANSIMAAEGNTILEDMTDNNNLKMQINSGSKGKVDNVGQMIACLGQQAYHSQQMLFPKNINGRSMCYFAKGDISPEAFGLVSESYLQGLSPPSQIYHNMAGIDGMMDTALKTAATGYLFRKQAKALEDYKVTYDFTVRNNMNYISEYLYGDNGLHPAKQMKNKLTLGLLNNEQVEMKYNFTNSEIKSFKLELDDKFKQYLQEVYDNRKFLRQLPSKTLFDHATCTQDCYLPFNLNRLIESNQLSMHKTKSKLEVRYVLNKIDDILKPYNTWLVCMTKNEMQNEQYFKHKLEQNAKVLLKIALQEYLSPKKLIINESMTKEVFDGIVDDIIKYYNRNIVEPGEMVGILAAQSLGEPQTQMTLNTFHSAGVANEISGMQGIPRIDELISNTKDIKTPTMTIYLKEPYCYDRKYAERLKNEIIQIDFQYLIKNITIIYETGNKSNSYHVKDDIVTTTNQVFFGDNQSNEFDVTSLPFIIRYDMNIEHMFELNVSLLDIKKMFHIFWTSIIDNKSTKKIQKTFINYVKKICILSNKQDSDSNIIHIRFQMQEPNLEKINYLSNFILDKYIIRGVKGITKVFISSIYERAGEAKDGAIEKKQEYVIKTNGINLKEILLFNVIDQNKLIINDTNLVTNMYGIVSTKYHLFNELTTVMGGYANGVNFQHINTLIQMMTRNGDVTRINRYGLNNLDNDPLSKASFEKTMDILINSSLHQKKDTVTSLVSKIMTGQCFSGGTGYVDIQLDVDKLLDMGKNTKLSTQRKQYLLEDKFLSDLI